MRYFDQPICQRCESDYATRKSPYCPCCAKLNQEAEELTDRIMSLANRSKPSNPKFVAELHSWCCQSCGKQTDENEDYCPACLREPREVPLPVVKLLAQVHNEVYESQKQ